VIGAAVPILLLLWLLVTAPLSRSLEPQSASSLILLSTDGEPIARRGAVIDEPIDIEELPDHVWQAFVAIEDRRFHSHLGVDPKGLARALWRNARAGSVQEGGSTITQQLAKQSFLSADRNAARKLQEMILAVWLEVRLSKEEILERYLSSAYFGDNVYGLRAAAKHYFDSGPESLTVGQAALLAGLLKAPTTLAPTKNLSGARKRADLVTAAMLDAGFLSEDSADSLRPAVLRVGDIKDVPTSTYFVDWLSSGASDQLQPGRGLRVVQTTLDARLQKFAVEAVSRAPLGNAQVALVAMRPDGRVVAMVGGKSHSESPFNRATQAQRQPGSTFKLFVYLAAAREGMRPESRVRDAPVTIEGWSPTNADGQYRGWITLRDSFRYSSNVATVRLARDIGNRTIVRTARDLGVTSELSSQPSLPLGTSAMTLLEMTSAYAAVAGNNYPVVPHGLAEESATHRGAANHRFDRESTRPMMLDLLWSAVNQGTGRAAALQVPTFGKTGTTQDNRDAIFIGFAEDLVTGVWIGNDDNSPLGDIAGGGLPAQIWRDFMAPALGTTPAGRVRQRSEQPRAGQPVVRLGRSELFSRIEGRGKGRGKGKGKGKRR
jgi:penicillin-binding protein 1A